MANSKHTRRALLSSIVTLLLCFTMLLGTTFAWFSDSVSTNVNRVQAGTLNVELLDGDTGASLEGKSLSWQKAAGHEDEAVLWEPGASYSLQSVVIKNSGNLALKYKVVISGINGSAKLNEVIDWTIKVDDDIYYSDTELHLKAGQSDTLTISGKMNSFAGNEYQGLTIDGISITVYATQDTVEYDSFGNQYDKNAKYDEPEVVKTVDELQAALEAGKVAVIGNNIETTYGDNMPFYIAMGQKAVINLNGMTISSDNGSTMYDGYANGSLLRADNEGTVITVNGDGKCTTSFGVLHAAWGGKLIINGGDYEKTHYTGSGEGVVYARDGGIIEINGGTFKCAAKPSNTLYNGSGSGSIIIRGGSFYKCDPSAYVAEGYKVVQSGDWYTVVSE